MSRIRFTAVALLSALTIAACDEPQDGPMATTATLSDAAMSYMSTVNWHAQQAVNGRSGPVAGASANLLRNANGISFRMNAAQLTPGNAYTLWLVVINNPGACASTPCTATDIFNPATSSQVRYAAGHVAGWSGSTTFAGHVGEGPLTGWNGVNQTVMFPDAMAAEVHLVVNDHGQMLPDMMPGMIHTYRGGCSDASPFPGVFPPTALADGEPGPNICRLYQAAVFTAP